jgi:hypothetical protein
MYVYSLLAGPGCCEESVLIVPNYRETIPYSSRNLVRNAGEDTEEPQVEETEETEREEQKKLEKLT